MSDLPIPPPSGQHMPVLYAPAVGRIARIAYIMLTGHPMALALGMSYLEQAGRSRHTKWHCRPQKCRFSQRPLPL